MTDFRFAMTSPIPGNTRFRVGSPSILHTVLCWLVSTGALSSSCIRNTPRHSEFVYGSWLPPTPLHAAFGNLFFVNKTDSRKKKGKTKMHRHFFVLYQNQRFRVSPTRSEGTSRRRPQKTRGKRKRNDFANRRCLPGARSSRLRFATNPRFAFSVFGARHI